MKQFKILKQLVETIGWHVKIPMEFRERYMPSGSNESATILLDFAAELSLMDRCERRALSRRKFAIRTLDAACDSMRALNSSTRGGTGVQLRKRNATQKA
ncbi:MAG TPA: hypothetical protein VLR92_11085 [Blastocatellia bacterium]|nr:hypothetical protein [Blastocatellia bacterium]